MAGRRPIDVVDDPVRVGAGCAVRTLGSAIETSTTRIHELVNAVRGFTYLDHAPTVEAVDIRRDLADTLTMLGAKTREKSGAIAMDLPPDLPAVHGVGAELNQVWRTSGTAKPTASLARHGEMIVPSPMPRTYLAQKAITSGHR